MSSVIRLLMFIEMTCKPKLHNESFDEVSHVQSIQLLSIADTRFAFIIIMTTRLKLIRRALEAMVMGEQWAQYGKDDH